MCYEKIKILLKKTILTVSILGFFISLLLYHVNNVTESTIDSLTPMVRFYFLHEILNFINQSLCIPQCGSALVLTDSQVFFILETSSSYEDIFKKIEDLGQLHVQHINTLFYLEIILKITIFLASSYWGLPCHFKFNV